MFVLFSTTYFEILFYSQDVQKLTIIISHSLIYVDLVLSTIQTNWALALALHVVCNILISENQTTMVQPTICIALFCLGALLQIDKVQGKQKHETILAVESSKFICQLYYRPYQS